MGGAIGKNNRLLGNIPADMRHFKRHTEGKSLIMGRKTFESILEINGEPLNNRLSIVITNDEDVKKYDAYEDVMVAVGESGKTAIDLTIAQNPEQEFVIIGGESIYKQYLPQADRVYLTIINHKFSDADAYFDYSQLFEEESWYVLDKSVEQCDISGHSLTFVTFQRRIML